MDNFSQRLVTTSFISHEQNLASAFCILATTVCISASAQAESSSGQGV